MKVSTFKRILLAFVIVMVLGGALLGGALLDRVHPMAALDTLFGNKRTGSSGQIISERVLNEESIVIDVADKASPSVVTVTIEQPERRVLQYNPFGGGFSQRMEGGSPQDIGSGFVVSKDGLIVTNKHVVQDTDAKYKIVTAGGKEYEVQTINRDPANDLAILKIDSAAGAELVPLELGSSENLKVGQFVMAIGTALGQFRHTVTTGVISGLGRGITAGDPYQGFAEKLDDVIQTDAAINPGNSGGPLLNSVGQVIGVNVAVAEGAQNIGFALPVNVLARALEQFNKSGSFASKAFLGVQYQMIDRQAAILNNVPQGAYVMDVVDGSPAEKSGIKIDDIITEIDGEKLADKEEGLAGIISKKDAGASVSIKLWRDGSEQTLQVNLTPAS